MTQQPLSPAPPALPDRKPILTWHDNVLYDTGYSQDIPWPGETAANTTLAAFLLGLGKIVKRETGVRKFDIYPPADPAQPGTIQLFIRYAPRPFGDRARGARGSGKSKDAAPAPNLTLKPI